MDINIKVSAGAKRNFIKEERDYLKVYLTAPAVEGKANKSLIKFLAVHYNTRPSKVEIIKGLKSKDKIVRISF